MSDHIRPSSSNGDPNQRSSRPDSDFDEVIDETADQPGQDIGDANTKGIGLGYRSRRRPDSDFDEVISETAGDIVQFRPELPSSFIPMVLGGFTIIALLVFVGGLLGRFDAPVELAVIAIYSSTISVVTIHFFRTNKNNRRI